MVAPLSLVNPSSASASGSVRELPEKEVAKAYAKALESQGWCIRTSSAFPMLFHAPSGRSSNLEFIPINFPKWSRQAGVRAATQDFPKFLDSLKRRVPSHLPCIQGSTFRPSPERFVDLDGVTLANTYKPFTPRPPVDPSFPELDGLFERLFPDKTERRQVLQFFAHAVQRPLERPQWGLLITGDGGEGKSLLLQAVECALGGHHCWRENRFTPLQGQFSEVLPDNLVVCLDDAKLPADADERLKHLMTQQICHVEVKGEQGLVRREVFARLVILSNSPRPLRLDNDRRWFCPARCHNPHSLEESREFGAKLAAFLDDPAMHARFYWYFMSVDLGGFNVGGCPQTDTHRQMSEASVSQLDRHIDDFLEDRTVDDVQPIFHESTLLDYLTAQGMRNINTDSVKLKMTDRGYANSIRRKLGNPRKDVRVWYPSDSESRRLTDSEKEEILRAAGLGF